MAYGKKKSRTYDDGKRKGAKVTKAKVLKWLRDNNVIHPPGSDMSLRAFGASADVATPYQLANRKMLNYQGPGAYFKPNSYVAGGLRAAGEWLGNRTAIPGMGQVGRHAAGAVSKYLGFGAYTTNQLVHGSGMQQLGSTALAMHSSNNERGDLVISNTEFIKNIYAPSGSGPTPFTSESLSLNAGAAKVFPWLSRLAGLYEEYVFRQLVFEYRPLSTDTSTTNNTLGTLIMMPNYNVNTPKPKTSFQMYNATDSAVTTPNNGLVVGVECDPSTLRSNVFFTEHINTSGEAAINDQASFIIATEGCPNAGALLGQLWVSYTVELRKKSVENINSIPFDSIRTTANASNIDATVLYSKANTGIWKVDEGGAASTTVIRVKAPIGLTEGTYMMLAVYHRNPSTPFGVSTGFTATTVKNLAFINSQNDSPFSQSVLAINTETRCGLITVFTVTNAEHGVAPEFTLTLSTAGVAGDVTVITITQITDAAAGAILEDTDV